MTALSFFENHIATADQDGTLNLDAYLAPGNVTPVRQVLLVSRNLADNTRQALFVTLTPPETITSSTAATYSPTS